MGLILARTRPLCYLLGSHGPSSGWTLHGGVITGVEMVKRGVRIKARLDRSEPGQVLTLLDAHGKPFWEFKIPNHKTTVTLSILETP